MTPAFAEINKAIYSDHHDEIIAKRLASPYAIRRYGHDRQFQIYADIIPYGSQILDVGCGEGVVSVLLAKHGCTVTGIDLSKPNIEACKQYAAAQGVADRTTFMVGDAENIPVPDKSFDYVISSHVLEHVPDIIRGVQELNRVAKKQVIAAIPTCLSPCCWPLLMGDRYWTFSRKSIYALPLGLGRVILAFITGQEDVNEGYAGREELIHIWRFPWRGKQLLQAGGLTVTEYRASSLLLPYFSWLLPVSRLLDPVKHWPVLRNFGYGTTYICEPVHSSESTRKR